MNPYVIVCCCFLPLGLGLGLVYLSSLVILSHYFDSRLSLANGIASSALGISSLVYPVLIDFLIKTYGWRGSLWIISGIVLHCVVFGALFRPFTAKDRKVLQEQWQKSQYKTDNKLDVCEKDDKEPITKKDENTEGISVFILIKKSVCLLSKPVFLVFAISYFFAYSCKFHTYQKCILLMVVNSVRIFLKTFLIFLCIPLFHCHEFAFCLSRVCGWQPNLGGYDSTFLSVSSSEARSCRNPLFSFFL